MKVMADENLIGKEIKFFRADGKPTENLIFTGGSDKETKEVMFFELLNMSENVKPRLLLKGKEPYKRLLIQRCFPAIKLKE